MAKIDPSEDFLAAAAREFDNAIDRLVHAFKLAWEAFKKQWVDSFAAIVAAGPLFFVPLLATMYASLTEFMDTMRGEIARATIMGAVTTLAEAMPIDPKLRQQVMTVDDAMRLIPVAVGAGFAQFVSGGLPAEFQIALRLKKALDKLELILAGNLPGLIVKQIKAAALRLLMMMITIGAAFFAVFLLVYIYIALQSKFERKIFLQDTLTQSNARKTVRDARARIRIGGTGR